MQRDCAVNEKVAQNICKFVERDIHAKGFPNAKVKCVTCDTHGCNGNGTVNGAAHYGPIALLIAIPVATVKIFSF